MIRDRKESIRPYKLVHQLLCIKSINFQKQSLIGLSEVTLNPLREVTKIKINSKQAKIYKILLNDTVECNFAYHDPTLEVCQDEAKSKQKSVDLFAAAYFDAVSATDPDRAKGEINIQVPPQLAQWTAEGKNIKVTIEFGVERPLGGVHFVVPEGEGSFAERGAHLFTSGFENCSRLWFPCIDTFSEPCLWKLEFTVDASMTAVSCGDLIETVVSSDLKRKTFHYTLNIPTSASNIGLAVGPFEIMVDPNMHEVTHLCLPHLYSLMKDTCSFLHEAFEFYEELLSSRYPYSCYKQIFVDEAYCSTQTYATMSVFDVSLLHSKHTIDQTYETRRILSNSLAEQFFGCFIAMNSYSDAWLTRGISGFLGWQYFKKAFGNNEYRFFVLKYLEEVVEYEETYGGFCLDPSSKKSHTSNDYYFSNRSLQTFSPLYDEAYTKKSKLVVRMLEDRVGRELLLQVFNKLLTLAANGSQQQMTSGTPNVWNNMLISTGSFSKAIFTVTGKDITHFLEQWVYHGGHPKFHGSFVFNRKRNTVELEIKQLETTATGIIKYMGPLSVWIQELDGTFKHNLQIEENATKHDITCHSKSRRNKKKKIPLCTGEEIDMDLSGMDADSPVLWIRIDPDMQLLRHVVHEQPDYQWQYQMRYERDVTAQMQAIRQLEKYPTPHTRKSLTDIIENEQCFYRIRCEAVMCLKSVANHMAATWSGAPAMMSIFRKLFGSYSCPQIIRLNNFSNFQLYFLQKTMPVAIAGLRSGHGICPQEVIRFLLDLFKYNDNSKNKFSDNYYRASLIEALAETVTPAVSAVLARSVFTQSSSSAEALSSETKLILEEITRYFNLDKLMPCYKQTVTISCLKAIRKLQKMGHLPSNPAFFKEYAQYGVFVEVRLAAIHALVDITKTEQRREDLDFLLDLVETDATPAVRQATLRLLTLSPPFTKKDVTHPMNTEDLVDRIWKMMNISLTHDTQLRSALLDFYFSLYGRSRPTCLPKPELSVVLNLKDKTAISNFPEEKVTFDQILAMDSNRVTEDSNSLLKRSAASEDMATSEKRLKTSDDVDQGDNHRHVDHEEEDDDNRGVVAGDDDVEEEGEIRDDADEDNSYGEGTSGREKVMSEYLPQHSVGSDDVPSVSRKEEKEGRSHSKPHKEKKKKKKKHKHKHKHKHRHESKEREKESRHSHRDSSEEPSDRHDKMSLNPNEDESVNASPLPSDDDT